MYSWDSLSRRFSDIVESMRLTEQDKKWHAEGNVAIHTSMVMSELAKKEDFVWNATNISKDLRKKLLDLAHSYKANVEIIYLERNLQQVIRDNKNRDYSIPQEAIEKMALRLDVPTTDEAEKVTYIINGEKL